MLLFSHIRHPQPTATDPHQGQMESQLLIGRAKVLYDMGLLGYSTHEAMMVVSR